MKPDGTDQVNLTRSPGIDDLYPDVSPDGGSILFMSTQNPPEGGGGRPTVRESL
jgi:Tol biopolymer transport system component